MGVKLAVIKHCGLWYVVQRDSWHSRRVLRQCKTWQKAMRYATTRCPVCHQLIDGEHTHGAADATWALRLSSTVRHPEPRGLVRGSVREFVGMASPLLGRHVITDVDKGHVYYDHADGRKGCWPLRDTHHFKGYERITQCI